MVFFLKCYSFSGQRSTGRVSLMTKNIVSVNGRDTNNNGWVLPTIPWPYQSLPTILLLNWFILAIFHRVKSEGEYTHVTQANITINIIIGYLHLKIMDVRKLLRNKKNVPYKQWMNHWFSFLIKFKTNLIVKLEACLFLFSLVHASFKQQVQKHFCTQWKITQHVCGFGSR